MVSWGILGAGGIAHRFAKSLSAREGAELVAISCRDAGKARSFAAQYGVTPERAFSDGDAPGSAHELLLACDDVDAIYLALPHGLHREWAERVLRSGKAVLCEKPMALNGAETVELSRIARETGALLMEGMKSRFVPVHDLVLASLAAGEIGEVTAVETSLCNDMRELIDSGTTYHSQPGQGGVLLDCGVYCASWLEELLPGEMGLVDVEGIVRGGIDLYVDATFEMDGRRGRLECAFDRSKPRTAVIMGTRGRIVVDELHRSQHATVFPVAGEPRELDAPYVVDDFYGEINHFCSLVEQGRAESDVMPLSASCAMARILDVARAGLVETL